MKKYACITGASSGIGQELARGLSKKGYSLILVARREDRLQKLAEELETDSIVIASDLRREEDIRDLVMKISDLNLEVFVNNAGFGDAGKFEEASLDKELDMIDVNVKALHILTKEMLNLFEKKGGGYILNIGSSAGLFPAGPYMATYYATKAYVVSFTEAIARELKEQHSPVSISVLCPGPVDTEFNKVADVEFSLKGITAAECASYALNQMFKRKVRIIPTITMKAAVFGCRFISRNAVIRMTGRQQKKKIYR
jgi:short-subunit dehydrogenase